MHRIRYSLLAHCLAAAKAPRIAPATTIRHLSLTRPLLKKKDNAKKANAPAKSSPSTGAAGMDMTKLEAACSDAHQKLTRALQEIKMGRDNVETIAAIKMPVTKEFLSAYADVIQRDPRTYLVTVFDLDHVKDVMSAITQANMGLNPQPVPKNPHQVTVPIPPSTNDFKTEQVRRIMKKYEVFKGSVRALRNDWLKRIQKSGASKDEIKDNERDVTSVLERAAKEAERLFEAAKADVK
jgi:ribosome recycling factor